MTPKLYFWKEQQVVIVDSHGDSSDIRQTAFLNSPCIDYNCDTPQSKYGMYTSRGWEHVPFSKFPKEFKVHLLLLGVPF